ncbi:MAG: hydrogenase formation protein HypD [Candidatus Omnitrophota bacterium]
MKYVDEFRNDRVAKKLSQAIHDRACGMKPINIMEVCGTHTMSICNFGIRDLLPGNINLISGPGCPVCVTPKSYVDSAIYLARLKDVIIATFGDMMRVPGSDSSLVKERTDGRFIKTVYSPLDAVDIAKNNPSKKIIFLGIGFETTSPTVAASLEYAKKRKIKNFFVCSGHKIIMPAMKALVEDKELNIDGFLCPAHVSAIIGTRPYEFIAKRYKRSCVVTGFEPLDILQGILMIIEQIKNSKALVENQYNRVVRREGNVKAVNLLKDVFKEVDTEWRGIGMLKKSGLALSKKYSKFNALLNFSVPKIISKPDKGCICGSILKGIKKPIDCKLFGKGCTPIKPQGACMVSSEGTCAAYYRQGHKL